MLLFFLNFGYAHILSSWCKLLNLSRINLSITELLNYKRKPVHPGELGMGNDEKSMIEMEIVGSIKRLDEQLRERDQQSEVIKELQFIQRKLKERERASHHKR